MLALIANLILSILSGLPILWNRLPIPPSSVLWASLFLGMAGYGIYFILWPARALRRAFPQLPVTLDAVGRNKLERILILFIRASGALFILVAIYLAWTRLGQ